MIVGGIRRMTDIITKGMHLLGHRVDLRGGVGGGRRKEG